MIIAKIENHVIQYIFQIMYYQHNKLPKKQLEV